MFLKGVVYGRLSVINKKNTLITVPTARLSLNNGTWGQSKAFSADGSCCWFYNTISSRPWHKLWWDDLVVLCSNVPKKSYGIESNELSLAEHLHGVIHFFEFYKKNLELSWILNIAKRMFFLRNTNLNARVREYSYGILFLGTIHIIPESPGFSFWTDFIPSSYISLYYLFTWYENDILFPY